MCVYSRIHSNLVIWYWTNYKFDLMMVLDEKPGALQFILRVTSYGDHEHLHQIPGQSIQSLYWIYTEIYKYL